MTESEHPPIDDVGEELQPIAIALQQHHEIMKKKFSGHSVAAVADVYFGPSIALIKGGDSYERTSRLGDHGDGVAELGFLVFRQQPRSHPLLESVVDLLMEDIALAEKQFFQC